MTVTEKFYNAIPAEIFYVITKNTERHTADMQITDLADYNPRLSPRFTNVSPVCYLHHIGLMTLITILTFRRRTKIINKYKR